MTNVFMFDFKTSDSMEMCLISIIYKYIAWIAQQA